MIGRALTKSGFGDGGWGMGGGGWRLEVGGWGVEGYGKWHGEKLTNEGDWL